METLMTWTSLRFGQRPFGPRARVPAPTAARLLPELPRTGFVSPIHMQGYYRDPEATAPGRRGPWFHTGDAGVLRADGYLRFVGRYKDMLKMGGENVEPMEVEGYLFGHQGVRQVAVVGYPDPRLSEAPVAFVQRAPGADVTAEALIAFCRNRIASFKIPRHMLFVDEFPMTSSGKIQKARLREEVRRLLG